MYVMKNVKSALEGLAEVLDERANDLHVVLARFHLQVNFETLDPRIADVDTI